MAEHHELGKKGEILAGKFLEAAGYQILAYNWRHRHTEIDCIAQNGNVLIFVEVKTRSTDYFGHPEESVDDSKIEKIRRTADAYIEKHDHNGEIRFDIVSIVKKPGDSEKIFHIKDAFFPIDGMDDL